jgi:Protein of unknown function (DUF2491)
MPGAKALRAGIAAFSMAVGAAGSSVNAVLPIVVATACMMVPDELAAKSGLRSSGGYRLRTPSIGSSRWSRTPSTSGGYRRPAISSPDRYSGPSRLPGSVSDRALSRRASREALERFRARSREVDIRRPPTGALPSATWDRPRRPEIGNGAAAIENWYLRRSWPRPAYIDRTPARFGVWDAAFLWYLLDTLSQPGHAEFFHHHRDDPGYAEWRAQANRLAGQDPLLRDKLAALDVRLAGLHDEPRSPDYLPPDTPAEVALATEPGERDADSGWGSLLLLALVGVVLYFGWRRLFIGWRPGASVQGGASPDRERSDKSYTPRWFRIGMTLPVDPAPFILAADTTHVRAPEAATRSGLLSIETVSEVETDGARWHRLYLPGGHDFFQAHLDDRDQPDECRYFSLLDEVTPASEEEWSFWLDEAEGVIGWPEFQTKDGKAYARLWAPGDARVAPREFRETLNSAARTGSRMGQAMLYGAPTGAAAPAPPTEYILVAAMEEENQAWVAIHAGIDLNPGLLSLS